MDEPSCVPTFLLDLVPPSPVRGLATCATSRRTQSGLASAVSPFISASGEAAPVLGEEFEQASAQASCQAACAQVELQAACAQVERSLVEHYVGLLEDERNKRDPIERDLHETRVLLERARSRRQARADHIEQERLQLLGKISDMESLQVSEHDAWTSQINLERSLAHADQERLRQRLQHSELCQRKLLQDVSSLLLERQALKLDASRMPNQHGKKEPFGVMSTPQRRHAMSASPTRSSSNGSPFTIAMRSGLKLSNVGLKCMEGSIDSGRACHAVEDGEVDAARVESAERIAAEPISRNAKEETRCAKLSDGSRSARIDTGIADKLPTPCRNTKSFAIAHVHGVGGSAEQAKPDSYASNAVASTPRLGKCGLLAPSPSVSPKRVSPRGKTSEATENETFGAYVRHMQVAAKRMS